MKANKALTTKRILKDGFQKPCTKLELQNIIFPKWDELGLIGMMFRQCVATKEQPSGNIYDEGTFQTVLRVVGGKVLISDRPDCYCWKFSKVTSAKSIAKIGSCSAEGILNLCNVLNGITCEKERTLVAEMFTNLKNDLLLVTTPAEKRTCIEVTEVMYYSGIRYCVDEWMETDDHGEAEATSLCIGDYLIVTDSGLYRIGHDEFCETHVI